MHYSMYCIAFRDEGNFRADLIRIHDRWVSVDSVDFPHDCTGPVRITLCYGNLRPNVHESHDKNNS